MTLRGSPVMKAVGSCEANGGSSSGGGAGKVVILGIGKTRLTENITRMQTSRRPRRSATTEADAAS